MNSRLDIEDLILNYDPEFPAPRFLTAEVAGALKSATGRLPSVVPWPQGRAPTAVTLAPLPQPEDDLSRFAGYDAVVMTWTAAEAAALAAVFTPDYLPSRWYEYRYNVAAYVPLVTGGRAPFNDKSAEMARYYHSLGLYFPCTIGGAKVLLFKSGLHPDYDGPALPLKKLVADIVAMVGPKMLITTGTGGGIGADVLLGDVLIASRTAFDCTTQFKAEPWATASYATSPLPDGALDAITPALTGVNAARIPNARPGGPKIWAGDATDVLLTTDFFGFDDSTNHYKLEGKGRVCDMGDAMVGQAMAAIPNVAWYSVRNASDPQIPNPNNDIKAAEKTSGDIYTEWGAFTTAASAIATWAIIDAKFNPKEASMVASQNFQALEGSVHPHPDDAKKLNPTDPQKTIRVSLILRRKPGHVAVQPEAVHAVPAARPSREQFEQTHGADPTEMAAVADYLTSAGLTVEDRDLARRTVIATGTVAAIDKAFNVQLFDYVYPEETYHGHDGETGLPASIAAFVEAVVGLTSRKVQAKHFSTASRVKKKASMDPPNTVPLTPAQVATLYNFPLGDGAGQTIGLYEMETSEGAAGYSASDIAATFKALGDLPMPKIVDVPVLGTTNSGTSDGETGLDITVAGAIAPQATIAVYFAGGQVQDMLQALQMMIHPQSGEPVPTVISISYGWGPDDLDAKSFTAAEWTQFSNLFQDAATNKITVLVSSGDSGAYVSSNTQAQTSYPGSDPWVTACGGTTIGNISGSSFDEYVWNDEIDGNPQYPGASGGGVSARFAVPAYQADTKVPARNGTGAKGRGVPDIAGNASANSGYLQVIGGQPPSPVGGTSAVAPLYAGLIARINANLGQPVGFLNTTLYSLPAATFRDVSSPPGPANNSYAKVKGYPAGAGWDACTGRGSVKGQALQTALAGLAKSPPAGK